MYSECTIAIPIPGTGTSPMASIGEYERGQGNASGIYSPGILRGMLSFVNILRETYDRLWFLSTGIYDPLGVPLARSLLFFKNKLC